MSCGLRFTPTVEVLGDRLTPSALPADIGVPVEPEAASHVRHRSFAIVDRTQFQAPSDAQPAASSFDSRAGSGVLKSTDAGRTW